MFTPNFKNIYFTITFVTTKLVETIFFDKQVLRHFSKRINKCLQF